MEQHIVIVRDFQAKPLVRHVWGIGAKVIYVTNESAGSGVVPIGFPRKDVFLYDDNYMKILNKTNNDTANWSAMLPYDK